MFPKQCLTLNIFEPRYRAMLQQVLEGGRMFAIASPAEDLPSGVEWIGGAGLVRACVGRPDGTSQLVLLGMCRVRFSRWVQMKPFPVAEVEVYGAGAPAGAPGAVAARLKGLRKALEPYTVFMPGELVKSFGQLQCPEALTDMVASFLLKEHAHRQAILSEESAAVRQELLLRLLAEVFPV